MSVGFEVDLAHRALRKLCTCLPERAGYLVGDVYARTVRARRFGGRGFDRVRRALDRSEHFTRSALADLQWRKFKRLLDHAYRNVEWYRRSFAEAGITPDGIKSYDDLPRIPPLTKDDLREHTDLLIADGVDRRRLIPRSTGGSTAKPVTVWWDRACYQSARAATVRWLRYGGVDEVRDRRVWVKRGTYRQGSDGSDFFGMYYPTQNEMIFSSTNMTPTVLRAYVERLRRFRPRAVLGYTSGIYVLASYLYEHGIDDVRIDVAQTSSDMLWPEYRKVINTAFHGETFNAYGLAERTCSASECERHAGMHVDMELCLMETIDEDGRHVFDGTGEILGTNLDNEAMPLIRYRVNDLGGLSRRLCPCGRESVLLDDFVGRTTDMVTTPDGRQFRLVRIYEIASALVGVREFQFMQPSRDLIEVHLVRRQGITEVDATEFIRRMRTLLGEEIRIEVRCVDVIPTTRGGKKQTVVSRIAAHPVPPAEILANRPIPPAERHGD